MTRIAVRPLLLLAAGALAPSWAQAQSSVSLSGSIDLVLRRDSGMAGGAEYGLVPGGARASRLTLSVREDLGGGYAAHVVMEGSMQPDVGTMGAGASLWNRMAAVNLGSNRSGYLQLGRTFTPIQAVTASPHNDPFGGAWLGGISTVYSKAVSVNNGLVYHYGYGSAGMVGAAPRSGFSLAALWAPGEAASPAPSRSGDQFGLGTSYGSGPWWFGASFHQIRGNSPAVAAGATIDTPRLRQAHVGMAYDFGPARVHLGLNQGRNDATGTAQFDRQAWSVGVTAKVGASGTARLLYGRANDRTVANRDFATLQMAYMHDLSRRTALYVNVGQVDNSANASTVLAAFAGPVPAGNTARSIAGGIRHNF